MFHRLWKPWILYQPALLARRAIRVLRPPPSGYVPIRTSWGVDIIADPTRTIGRSILTTGVYDLSVSEALARLISRGDTVIDAGANVGYATVLASVAAGPKGRVLSFEPHPGLFAILRQNVAAARERLRVAPTELHESALGVEAGTAELHIPGAFGTNDGIARIGPDPIPGGESVPVRVETLDDVLGEGSVEVLKLDVEGFEPQVLRGAARALAERRVRHIVFEEHSIERSAVVRILREAGYRVFSLGWTMRGPVVLPIEAGNLAKPYEPANFIATLDPELVLERCRSRGWSVLRARLTLRWP